MPINSFLYPGPTNSNPYVVDNSCRFNDADTASLTLDLSGGAGNRKTWTCSFWFKLGNMDASGVSNQRFLSANTSHSDANYGQIGLGSGDYLEFGTGTQLWRRTNRLFRDPSAWYHIVVAMDTTQGTASNRVKIWVNGTQETSFAISNDPTEDADYGIMGAVSHAIGKTEVGSQTDDETFDGYLAEFAFLDGTATTASSFGEFDEDSPTIWKPKNLNNISGTKGTNGFYLDFEDSANLGNDAWGGTDLTESNLAAADQCQDSPTNNFCTLNPLDVNVAADLTSTEGNTIFEGARYKATFGVSSGKWYWEVKRVNAPDNAYLGIKADDGDWTNTWANSYTYYTSNGNYYLNGSSQGSFGDSSTTNDILNFALDMDNGKFYIGKNGTWYNSGDPAAGSNEMASSISGTYLPAVLNNTSDGTDQYSFNFGNPSFTISSGNADANGYGNFEYAPPSGTNTFYALCSKNLAEYG